MRLAGTMLFSFHSKTSRSNDQHFHAPMRVHVFQATVNSTSMASSTSSGDSNGLSGVWVDWDEIPYDQMWADDILWLPWFLTPEPFPATQDDEEKGKNDVCLEGHFIFDGPPGPNSPLIVHNCRQTNK